MNYRRKQGICKKCNNAGVFELVRNITNSGTSQVYWMCRFCKDNANGSAIYIKHEKIKAVGIEIDDIKVINDYRSLENACVVCGELGAALHHFAPRYLFGDRADDWPTGYLCNFHHMQWHGLVTPDMCKRKKT